MGTATKGLLVTASWNVPVPVVSHPGLRIVAWTSRPSLEEARAVASKGATRSGSPRTRRSLSPTGRGPPPRPGQEPEARGPRCQRSLSVLESPGTPPGTRTLNPRIKSSERLISEPFGLVQNCPLTSTFASGPVRSRSCIRDPLGTGLGTANVRFGRRILREAVEQVLRGPAGERSTRAQDAQVAVLFEQKTAVDPG
jgi:hypothetical protein